jgi:hypothetical protein
MINLAPTRGLQRRLTRPHRVKATSVAGRSYKPRNLAKSVTVE